MVLLKDTCRPVTLEQTKIIAEQMERYVCKVDCDNGGFGTGFFCNVNFNNIIIPSLITAMCVIDAKKLLSNGIIKIRINEEEKVIQINENRTLYSNEEYNITIIEIKPEDKIDHFLEIDEGILRESTKNIYIGNSIYCIQYIEHLEKIKVFASYGILKNIYEDEEKMIHYCSTEIGSSGSPIFDLKTNRVIGIHVQGSSHIKYNIGCFLTKPIIEFIREIEIKNKYNEYKSKAFSNLKLISSGSYGKIYSAFDTIIKNEICLKKINLEEMKLNYEENELTDYLKDLSNEIKILKMLSNRRNSVKFYGTYEENNEKVIIMEKCDKNLKQFIKERGKGMEIEEIKNKFSELNELFKIIQKETIIHRDLKLENFLIKYTDDKKTKYIIKLCDYGIGKFKNQSNGIFSGLKGSLDTVAPEILLQKTKTFENTVDIFSLGIILYQISHNLKHPFAENYIQYGNVYTNNYEKDYFKIEFDKSIKNKDFIDLITKMIKLNPKNRLKWDEYFDHPFFK